ncbi:MAG: phosphate ABC transporter substrate-binding protein PstS [Desulforhopalus sp.]|nr:phosphate ABC transporter substrate-binding protein PstS [Desulforhopalus sp.]
MKVRKFITIAAVSLALTVVGSSAFAEKTKLVGSGASFPYPIYSTWFNQFSKANSGIQVNYQSKGSGAGIRDFLNGVVDFAASDAAMKEEEMAKEKDGVQLLPMTAGEVVLAYNLKGVKDLKLSRKAYTGIFLGKVKTWNDPLIAEANPGMKLPATPITVVARADSSGTTYVFTKHLSAISPEFAEKVGVAKQPSWPTDINMIKSPKNAGVNASIKRSTGAIGYTEYGYARMAKLNMVSLENKEGNYIAPGLASGQAALANVKIPENMIAWVSDPAGKDSYPIATYTWMIFHKKYADAGKAAILRQMVNYCLDNGQSIADQMGYIPLPANVIEQVKAAAENIK